MASADGVPSISSSRICESSRYSAVTSQILSSGCDPAVVIRRTTDSSTGSPDIAQTNFAGAAATFSYSFAPLSMTLFTFAPTAPMLTVLPPSPQPGGQILLQLTGQPGVSYVLQNSTNMTSWTSVTTNAQIGASLTFTNPVPAGSARQFWRALWEP